MTSALWMGSLGGCNIVAPAVVVAAGPEKVEAKHILADVPTVVFIDDPKSFVSRELRRVIADTAGQELMVNECVNATISPQDAMLIAARSDRASDPMSIEEIGKAVGAQQVVYVRMTQFAKTPDGYTPRPAASALVKVIDLASMQAYPPKEISEGWPVNAVGAPVDPSLYSSRTSSNKILESLALQLGDEIAKVFYKHEYKELGQRLR
jgi:hypothetical protein